jgi:uncharacterized protein (DUF58 family)
VTRVVLTTRGAALLAAGFFVLFLAFYSLSLLLFVFGTFLVGFVGAELLVFAFATRGFGPAAFAARRVECSSFVPVHGAAFVAVRLEPRLAHGVFAEVFDAHSDRLRIVEGSARLVTWWSPGVAKTLAYVTTPETRGRFELGPTIVVAHDTFGFGFKEVALATPWTLEAIPSFPLLRLRRPERFPTPMFGQAPAAARGAGMDFHSLREYATTDDPRKIAWTHSGKGTMYVREFQRENQEEVLVLLDVGRAMGAGPPGSDALERAVSAAGLAAQQAFEEDVRFGLLLFSDRVVRHLRPGRGSEHEFAVARALAGAELDPHDSSFVRVLQYLGGELTRPSHLLAFTTVGGDAEGVARTWGGLARVGHRLSLFVPDLAGIYPPLGNEREEAVVRLLARPEAEELERRVGQLERLGVSVARYGQSAGPDQPTFVFATARGRPVAV